MIKAALNGGRSRAEHRNLPTTPDELANAARRAVEAGAEAVHVHARDDTGKESLRADHVARAILAIRNACPQVPVGVTTRAKIEPDPQKRCHLFEEWEVLPDFVSLNFDEPDAPQVLASFLDRGIAVEAGLSNLEAASVFAGCRRAAECLRILIEPADRDTARAVQVVTEIEALLDAHGFALPRLLHGEDAVTWDCIRLAAERGYDTRIGLEDTLRLPDGSLAEDNAELVRQAAEITRAARVR